MPLFQRISIDDIEIYGKNIEEDTRKAGYNIGDLLNMPYLCGKWNQCPHKDDFELLRLNLAGQNYNNSILHYYCKNRDNWEPVPSIPRLISATNEYTMNLSKDKELFSDISDYVESDRCLFVHIRAGDTNVEEDFILLIYLLSYNYEKVILLSGIHLDEQFSHNNQKKENIVSSINRILEKNNNIYLYTNDPDVHISIMSIAKNLLLHKGGFSCIGYIVSTGTLFITAHLSSNINHINFKNNIQKHHYLLELPKINNNQPNKNKKKR